MDPRIVFMDWLQGIATFDNARNYNDWIGRGGFPIRIAVTATHPAFRQGDVYARVMDIRTWGKVQVVFERSGIVGYVPKTEIDRVVL